MSEVENIDGIKQSGWTGGLKIEFRRFFGKGKSPPGLQNVFFQFTSKEHGEKLWRVSLQFKKIDHEAMFNQEGIIDEAAQEMVIESLYPDAVIKSQTESYKCGDFDITCKSSGSGGYGKRTWIYVLLIDEEIFKDAVIQLFNENKDKY